MLTIDASQVRRLEVSLLGAELKVQVGMYGVLKHAAQNVKEGMVADAQGHPRFPAFPASIGYDITPSGLRGVSARVGPDKAARQGALGNLLYFGTSKTAPVLDIGAPLERERPNLERALLDLGAGALL